MSTRLVIERRGPGLAGSWEVFAHPKDDVQNALRILRELEVDERKKIFSGRLRLVRVTREVITPNEDAKTTKTPLTDAAVDELKAVGFLIYPEHARLIELSRRLERELTSLLVALGGPSVDDPPAAD